MGIDLCAATDSVNAQWQPYQLRLLSDEGRFSIDVKSRQIGWSWTIAAEALADAYLNPRHTAIFVSLNQDDAREKIRYARQIHEALPANWRKKLVSDSQNYLELDNGSRLISHSSRPPRGKRATVYLDELAHCAMDRDIYRAAVGMTTRGGRIRLGSTPLGRSGIFWEIASQSLRPYPGYVRRYTPWWHVPELCTDRHASFIVASKMPTAERVERFGTLTLLEIYQNMIEEDFRQEYELDFQDETTAWITWEEIKGCQDPNGDLLYFQAADFSEGMQKIRDLSLLVEKGEVEADLYAGMDIGRTRDKTEIIVLGHHSGKICYRLGVTLHDCPFDRQEEIITALMTQTPVRQLWVDRSGLGMPLAERLESLFGFRVRGVEFNMSRKESWAIQMRLAFQKKDLIIPQDRDLAYQIHSIRKQRSSSGHSLFDAERTEGNHADKFWALSLALSAATSPIPNYEKIRQGYRI